jgi:hypothetical protein
MIRIFRLGIRGLTIRGLSEGNSKDFLSKAKKGLFSMNWTLSRPSRRLKESSLGGFRCLITIRPPQIVEISTITEKHATITPSTNCGSLLAG